MRVLKVAMPHSPKVSWSMGSAPKNQQKIGAPRFPWFRLGRARADAHRHFVQNQGESNPVRARHGSGWVTFNPLVGGSNPPRPTKFFKALRSKARSKGGLCSLRGPTFGFLRTEKTTGRVICDRSSRTPATS